MLALLWLDRSRWPLLPACRSSQPVSVHLADGAPRLPPAWIDCCEGGGNARESVDADADSGRAHCQFPAPELLRWPALCGSGTEDGGAMVAPTGSALELGTNQGALLCAEYMVASLLLQLPVSGTSPSGLAGAAALSFGTRSDIDLDQRPVGAPPQLAERAGVCVAEGPASARKESDRPIQGWSLRVGAEAACFPHARGPALAAGAAACRGRRPLDGIDGVKGRADRVLAALFRPPGEWPLADCPAPALRRLETLELLIVVSWLLGRGPGWSARGDARGG